MISIISNKSKTVLICPLNWGLGHASRNVIIIKKLLDSGFKVIIGADKAPLLFLQAEFPELPFIKIPSVEIKYPKGKRMVLKMLFSMPKILYGIVNEHKQLKKILANNDVDIVISDNRYGLWSKNVYSIFITHQLEIQLPEWMNPIKYFVNKINYWFIRKYNLCWVPDFLGNNNVAEVLSHPKNMPKNIRYVGLLSRFKRIELQEKKYDILAILSGPEPQRSVFEQILIKELKTCKLKALIVQGKPGILSDYNKYNIDFVSHLSTENLGQLISTTPVVISRSGYSSIMDYISLKKNAILVPTPGQTEQEYLAKILKEKYWFYSVNQNEFNIKTAIKQLTSYQIPDFKINSSLLEKEIENLLKI